MVHQYIFLYNDTILFDVVIDKSNIDKDVVDPSCSLISDDNNLLEKKLYIKVLHIALKPIYFFENMNLILLMKLDYLSIML